MVDKVSETYGSDDWEAMWQAIVETYSRTAFRDFVKAPAIEHWDPENPGNFGGLAMSDEESNIFIPSALAMAAGVPSTMFAPSTPCARRYSVSVASCSSSTGVMIRTAPLIPAPLPKSRRCRTPMAAVLKAPATVGAHV